MDLIHAKPLALGQSTEIDEFLADVQSNILGPHRRQLSTHWLLSFPQGGAQLKDFIDWLIAQRWITSAADGLQPVRPEKYGTVMFSRAGLDLLPASFLANNVPPDPSFAVGAEARELLVIDKTTADWDARYLGRNIHVHLALASKTPDGRLSVVEQYLTDAGITVVTRENGFVLRNEYNDAIEHFGFRDGLSNPVFLKSDMPRGRTDHWTPEFRLAQVVREFGPAGKRRYGSFCVLRKIEQDVTAFEKFEDAWTAKHGTKDGGAHVIGRTRDGRALETNRRDNDFNYGRGDSEARCPFHAHVRKTNPRTTTPSGDISRNFVMARRAMSYDDRTPEEKSAGVKDRNIGLLFMAYMASVEGQFEHVMRHWVNDPSFPQPSGPDPLIGRPPPGDLNGVALARFVRTKGAEYFFVPPISWLKALLQVTT